MTDSYQSRITGNSNTAAAVGTFLAIYSNLLRTLAETRCVRHCIAVWIARANTALSCGAHELPWGVLTGFKILDAAEFPHSTPSGSFSAYTMVSFANNP